jgi:glycerol-3-phosphate dehydrogenase
MVQRSLTSFYFRAFKQVKHLFKVTTLDKIDIIVIGAGVIGLAVGAAIVDKDKELYILEKEEVYGQGTSSRNSEVIHAGIYYP